MWQIGTTMGDWRKAFLGETQLNQEKKKDVLSYELDWLMAGCSGYVTYRMFDTNITIAFSNPTVGGNKLGVGTGGKRVWDCCYIVEPVGNPLRLEVPWPLMGHPVDERRRELTWRTC